jgi:heptosyltransferase-2
MNRILIVNVNWLGDAILTTPLFKAVKTKYPKSYLAVMCVERVREVFENNPYVNEIIIFDEKGEQKSISAKLKFAKFLKEKNFDTAFFIHRSFTRIFICFLAGIKNRIGYWRLKSSFILTRKIKPPQKGIHRQDYYLYLFEAMGIPVTDKIPQIFPLPRFKDKFNKILSEARGKYTHIVGINPSGNWRLKLWPAQNFAFLCDRLVKELQCAILFVGATKDHIAAEEVIGRMEESSYNLCGRTNIRELAALMQEMALFVSNDSGPAHLAAALGIDTLVLFGPTSPEITSPRGKRVKIIKKDIACTVPCYKLNCKDNTCMAAITVDEVFAVARDILSKKVNQG